MALGELLAAVLSLCLARAWAATTHPTSPWEPADKSVKAGKMPHLDSRVHKFYSHNGYEACQHHPQLGWLHLYRTVSPGTSTEPRAQCMQTMRYHNSYDCRR